jgi:DNA-binding winged helix-turn-helix (wHTH) protein
MQLRFDGRAQDGSKDARLLVMVNRRQVWLPTRLYELLEKLYEKPGEYVETSQLAGSPEDKVHQLVYRIRRDLVRQQAPVTISNTRGKGYRVEC